MADEDEREEQSLTRENLKVVWTYSKLGSFASEQHKCMAHYMQPLLKLKTLPRGQCYETLYGRRLQIFVIS